MGRRNPNKRYANADAGCPLSRAGRNDQRGAASSAAILKPGALLTRCAVRPAPSAPTRTSTIATASATASGGYTGAAGAAGNGMSGDGAPSGRVGEPRARLSYAFGGRDIGATSTSDDPPPPRAVSGCKNQSTAALAKRA